MPLPILARQLCLTLIAISVSLAAANAQGDECSQALRLPNARNYCSAAAEFTSEMATRGTIADDCGTDSRSPDVWLSFVAEEAGAVITLIGEAPSTLQFGKFSLYGGSCGNLVEVQPCGGEVSSSRVSSSPTTLVVGNTYYIRVYTGNNSTGTFQLCLRAFDPALSTSSDCTDARILCGDPQSISVPILIGAGRNTNEVPNTSCLNAAESNSTWLKFTVRRAGMIEFTLITATPDTDLDFAVFSLPGGLDDCDNGVIVRCSSAGDSNCEGNTGLRIGATDLNEPPGCNNGQDKFVAALDAQQDESYAILVNNYSANQTGFQLDWGRTTATFAGPDANFTQRLISANCQQTRFQFEAPPAAGATYAWDFGDGASPSTSTSPSPIITFSSGSGAQSIVLTVTSGECAATVQRTINVGSSSLTPIQIGATPITDNCSITEYDFTVDNPESGIDYTWMFGPTATPATATGAGPHRVTFRATSGAALISVSATQGPCAANAETTVAIAVGDDFTPSVVITDPTCLAPDAGRLEVNVDLPGDYLFALNGGAAQANGMFTNLSAGSYRITVRRASLPAACTLSVDADLTSTGGARPRLARLTADATSCTGATDGRIEVEGAEGTEISRNGEPFASSVTYDGLSDGDYTLSLRSAGGCLLDTMITVDAGAGVDFAVVSTRGTSCPGAADGEAVLPQGAASYTLGGGTPQMANRFGALPAGTYTYSASTAAGCRYDGTFTIMAGNTSPGFGNFSVTDASCPEVSDGRLRIATDPTRQYRLDGNPLGPGGFIDGLAVGPRILTVSNRLGCTADTLVNIGGQDGFRVDLGPDQSLVFGDEVTLRPTLNVTDRTTVTFVYSGFNELDSTRTGASINFIPTTTPLIIRVTSTDERGCSAEDNVLISLRVPKVAGIPTAFSPNGDLVNDRFTILGGPEISLIQQLQIYDRWGGLRYSLEDFPASAPDFGWDGTSNGEECEVGVYAYFVTIEYADGDVRTISGSVNLIR